VRSAAYWSGVVSLILLALLCVSWEAFLAPLRPGGSALMLKAVPLLAPLFGLLHERIRAFQWTSLLVLAYFCEGVVRAWSDTGRAQQLAVIEIVLAVILFASCLAYVQARRRTSA
jgi:uncharacterized membrane protein